MATVTKPIALDESFNTTELTPRNIADVLAQELSRITGRNASQVEYDNTESGLTADNVQEALDEIVEDIPTVPSVDIQTAVDEFSTYNGGILDSLKVALTPNQDLHGYDEPWVGGAGKNKLEDTFNTGTLLDVVITADNGVIDLNGTGTGENSFAIKSRNTSGNYIYMPKGSYIFSAQGIGSGVVIGTTYNGAFSEIARNDSGESVAFSITDNTPSDYKLADGSVLLAVYITVHARAYNHQKVYPMIRLSSVVDDSFAPYSNICPISGHTQVDVDVSDGDTTQEQVTVNLGGTYYSGTLDVVSGVFTPDTASVVFDGSENWTIFPSDTSAFFFVTVATMTSTSWSYVLSEVFKDVYKETDARNNDCSIWSRYQQIHIHAPSSIAPSGVSNEGLAEFKAWLSNNPQKVVYKLANPTPIQLSPTMVKALVGENHLSAPLDGQEITESKYRELFTWDEVEAYVNAHSGGGSGMNYSTEEQVVGTWIDGKPIYERTWDFSGSPVMLSYSDWVDSGIPASENIKSIISAELKYGVVNLASVEVGVNVEGYPIGFQKLDNLNTRGVSYCTLRYTKTTD